MKRIIVFVFLFSLLLHQSSRAQSENQYLEAPNVIFNHSQIDKYKKEKRQFSGISSIAVSKSGTIWAVWYTGQTPDEDQNNYVVLSKSKDQGQNWEEVLAIDPRHEIVRAYDPEIWIDPKGRLWVFWAQARFEGRTWNSIEKGTRAGVWSIMTEAPDAEIPIWQDPRRLCDGVMMCKPMVLSTGEWVLPSSLWQYTEKNAQMLVSEDEGKSWNVRGGATVPREVRGYDEHMIVEKKDRSLWMLIRTNYGIGQSFSFDRGKTWSMVTPSSIQHTSARFFIYRLHSGNLLLIKHGPVEMKTGRSHLFAFISDDDGHNWTEGLLLDERPGISYPDAQQTTDGVIYITYDFDRKGRQQIFMTTLKEDDIRSGSNVRMLEVFQRRKTISVAEKP
ncbi:MAG: exo-alpha-sialidase [Cyclobacteriaceae bacterium]|nr:exo-alpha-sialidase [Cyclobacteriaceae bacterium]